MADPMVCVVSVSPEAGSGTVGLLTAAAAFLAGFPGLPDASVMCSGSTSSVSIQFAHLPAGEMFPAVARVAEVLGAGPVAVLMPDGVVHFRASGAVGGHRVAVYAATCLVTDPDRPGVGGGDR